MSSKLDVLMLKGSRTYRGMSNQPKYSSTSGHLTCIAHIFPLCMHSPQFS